MFARAVASTLMLVSLSCGGCAPEGVEAESGAAPPDVPGAYYAPNPGTRIRSVTFSSSRPPEPGTLEALSEMGVSHVTLIPFGFQRSIDSTKVSYDPNRRWYTESDRGICEIAEVAKNLKMGTILKPHIWVGDWRTSGQRRDRIGFRTEEEWAEWESSYRDFILHYARLAHRTGTDVFVIGTELARAARTRPDYWRSIAAEVRTVYGGRLTYAANWYAEYEDIEFWGSLDYVGVQAYFPLSESRNPSLDHLKAGWEPHVEELRRISAEAGRPVFFTEIGYRSVPDAAKEPWRWASRRNLGLESPDPELQADLYRAFFEKLWHQRWFAGASLWRWHSLAESREPVRAIDFTPQGKPSLSVIRDWYTGEPGAAGWSAAGAGEMAGGGDMAGGGERLGGGAGRLQCE